MSIKPILHSYSESHTHFVGDGFRVSNYIPGANDYNQETNPFIMLDYNEPYHFPPSKHRRGVGEHPHRGFETVTIVYEGELEHRDSSGGGGIISKGDVQWMTAASGVLHEEFQTQHIADNGGTQHAVQLWVNLPAKDKMSAPKYQSITDAQIAKHPIDNNGSVVRVIAGNYKDTQGPASTFSPIELYDVRLNKDANVELSFPPVNNTMLVVTKGSVTVNGTEVVNHKGFVLFKNEGEIITIKANEDSFVLVMSGAPINEPIARYGPFVMNTREELMQAVEDFNSGKFGKI